MAEIKKISTELQLLDKFLDTSGDAGTSGQVLTSTGTGINWVSAGTPGSGVYLPLIGGTMTGTAGVLMPDNFKLKFGDATTPDLEIYHDGSHSRIKDAGAGSLTINATDFVVNNSADTKNMIIAVDGGATTLFCNGANRLATTSTGVAVTGNGIFTGNVGIGETSPTSKLSIKGAQAAIDFQRGTGDSKWEFSSDAARFYIAEMSTGTRDYIMTLEETTGNVGIGTTSPNQSNLVVSPPAQSADVDGITVVYNPDGATNRVRAQLKIDDFSGILELTNSADTIATYITAGGDSYFNGGNVGIGTTSPSAKLEVQNHATTTSIADIIIDGKRTDGNNGAVGELIFSNNGDTFATVAGFRDGADNKGSFQFQTQGASGFATRMTIATEGEIILNQYTLTQQTANSVYLLGVDSTGKVVQSTNIPSGTGGSAGPYLPLSAGSGERVTGDLYISEAIFMRPSATYGGGYRVMTATGTNSAPYTSTLSFSNYGQSNVMVIQGSNVGIGTTSPANKLNVNGDIGYIGVIGQGSIYGNTGNSSYANMQLYNPATGYSTFNNQSYGYYFNTSGGTKLTILNNGNVGIGTTSPDEFLDIEGDADVYAKIQYTGNGSNTPADHAGLILSHGRSTWYLHNKYSAGSGAVGSFSIASSIGTNALTILNANRNVGIGTDAPTAKLHVNGSDFKVTNGNEEAINVDLDNYVYKFGDISGGETQSFLEISSADSEAYFLNCDLGIGTSSPQVPLDVTTSDTGSSFNDGAVQISNTTSASSGGATVINIRNNYGGGFGTLIKFFRTSTSSSIANISFNSGGTAVNYNTGSDYRLKEDLQTFNGLDILNNISVYNYKWKGVDFRGYGVIAHELQSIFPDAVTGEKDAEEMQSVDYSKLVPVLIKSVQELKKEIELLKQQLNK